MNSFNVPTPKTINTNTAKAVPLELLLTIANSNPRNVKQATRLFAKKDVLKMTTRQVSTLIYVAVASNEAEIRPHYAEFRRLARMMQGRGKRLADDITRFGLVERTRKNPDGNEHARSINHLLNGDEYLKSDPTVLQIRVLSCIRIALLALTHHRHELPFLTPNNLPLDVELDAWTPAEITRLHEIFGATPTTAGNDASDESDGDDDSYDGSSASAASPAPAQKEKQPKTYQHPWDRSPPKPLQTEAEYRIRRDRMLSAGAHPPTVAARAFVPSPLPPTRPTNTNTTNPSRAAAAPVSVHHTDSSTIYDGPIADLLSVLESITDRDERAVIQGELDQLIAAARAELTSREPDYGVFTSSIKSLEASKEHADPALIESIYARIASLKKAATRIAAK